MMKIDIHTTQISPIKTAQPAKSRPENPLDHQSVASTVSFRDRLTITQENKIASDKTQASEEKQTVPRVRLSDKDIAQLAEKYDLHNMSQERYDDFLEDLMKRGVLTVEDAHFLGYHGLVDTGADTDELNEKGAWLAPVYQLQENKASSGNELIRSLQDADGDLLCWLEAELLWKVMPDDRSSAQQYGKARQDAFQTLLDISKQMM